MRYSKGFTKVVHGCFIVEANSKEEAEKKLDDDDIEEEYDNKSNYELDKDWEEMD